MSFAKKLAMSILRIGFLLFCVNFGCSIFIPRGIDIKIQPYVSLFERELKTPKITADIGLASLKYVPTLSGGNVVGICLYLVNAIILDRDAWNRSTSRRKTALVFHELGHCYCNDFHRDEELPDKCPASLMNPVFPSDYCLRRHWLEYLNEFKKEC